MAKNKKKKKQSQQQPLSPKKYITTKARALPLYKCLINKDWNESKLASIIVIRKHTNGNVTAGFFLVDMLARGVKGTHYKFNIPETIFFDELFAFVPEDFLDQAPYVLVHNIIYGAIAFAEEHNFIQHSDFTITQYLLEEDTEDIELIDLTFGIDGKPVITNFDDDIDDEFDEFENDELTEEYYETWTDEQWRDFFADSDDSEQQLPEIVNVLFNKWYHENYSMAANIPGDTKESSMRITKDALSFDYHANEAEYIEMQDIFLELQNEPSVPKVRKLEMRLHQMIDANPKNPILYNYLGICAQIKKDDLAYRDILDKIIEKFPNYLFGKIAFANIFIDEGNYAEAEKLFTSFYLTGLFPDRYTFHVTEFIGFHSTLLRIFILKGDIQQAVINYNMLKDLDDEDLDFSNIFLRAESEFFMQKIKVVSTYIIEKNFV